MLTSSTMLLRVTPMRACGIQPVLLRSTTCPSSSLSSPAYPLCFPTRPQGGQSKKTTTSSSTTSTRGLVTTTKPAILLRRQAAPKTSSSVTAQRRAASTSAAEQDAAAAAAAAAQQQAAQAAADQLPLDWNTFFALRKQRRRLQLLFSAVGCLGGGTLGAVYLSTGQADWLVNQVPLDPLVTLGLMTFGCAALGWLLGPSAGSAIFYTIRRKYKGQMMVKESQFFSRIKKHRVDPSNSSAGNPVPDFYGEKIQSVAGYRQWLKDQRAYNKKRTTFI